MKLLIVTAILVLSLNSNVNAAGSAPKTPSVSKDIKLYNKGVELMLNKEFAKAEKQFRKALELNERFAEAHNNLAYTLRKQGADNYEEALIHYNRAIELNSQLPEPYMYRGVLYIQMGKKELALKDHEKLVAMESPLAGELEYVVTNNREKKPEQFFGVSSKR
jgi:tetratricopeptide (TPR) repeat protein